MILFFMLVQKVRLNMNDFYILVYQYHDTYIRTFSSISLLILALAKLNEVYRNDNEFKYVVYCVKDITLQINIIENK